jgi:hypothetical protein
MTMLAADACASGMYVLGITGEADTADGRAIGGFVDYGFTEETWLSAALSHSETVGVLGGLKTVYGDVSLEHSFGLAGVRAGAAYWGDNDLLDSVDLRGSVFFRGENATFSVDYERRDFDFVFQSLLDPDIFRTTEFTADGIGAAASLRTGSKSRLYASGMSYDYSRDLRVQPDTDLLRFFSSSRLGLMNSLIDYRISGGIEFRIDQRTLDFTLSSWRTAIDGGQVNSFAIGFVTPSGPASDVEFRIAYDESENFGNTFSMAISFYYFGA